MRICKILEFRQECVFVFLRKECKALDLYFSTPTSEVKVIESALSMCVYMSVNYTGGLKNCQGLEVGGA